MVTYGTTRDLKIIFSLDNDKTTTLSLRDPKNNLALSEVMEITDAMLAKEAIVVGGSAIEALKDAYIQSITITALS